MLLVAAATSVAGGAEQAAALPTPAGDSFRVVAVRPGGRSASVYEGRRRDGRSERTIVDLVADGAGDWSATTRETRYLAGETFDYFVAQIDAAAAGPADGTSCADGAALLARHGARSATGCGADDAAGRIARALGLIDEEGPTLLK